MGCVNTSGMQGADLNRAMNTSATAEGVMSEELARHANLLQDENIFDEFFGHLDI